MAKKRKKPLILSASQFETALDCERKWWFGRVARLPETRRTPDPRTLGDILHEVLERWLGADERGMDKDGNLLDLYPPGWTQTRSKFGADKGEVREIDEVEAAMIKKLVTAAIAEGVVTRAPGGVIEKRFDIRIGKTEAGEAINVTGYRDYTPSRDHVEDHKTCKRDKSPWRKTSAALYKGTQGRVYMFSLIHEAKARGEEPPGMLHFTHNQFIKDPEALSVKKTPTKVERQVIEDWWTSVIVPLGARLAKVRLIEEWHAVEAPTQEGACNRYGGCAYMKICNGRWSVKRYKTRVERANRPLPTATAALSDPNPTIPTSPKGHLPRQLPKPAGATMGLMDRLQQMGDRNAAAKAPAATPPKTTKAPAATKPAQAPQPATPAAPPASLTFEGDTPPWAQPACGACKGKGFNSRGKPCRVCDLKTKRAGGKPSSDFEVFTDDGVIAWSDGAGQEGAVEILGGDVKTSTAAVAPEPAAEELEAEAPAAAEEPEPEPEAPAAAAAPAPKEKKGRGRPKKGFTLLINCAQIKGTGAGSMTFLDEVIARHGQAIAEASGVESFFDLNAFDRRDALKARALAMIEEFGSSIVIATTTDLGQRELLAAIRPAARTVIQGLA